MAAQMLNVVSVCHNDEHRGLAEAHDALGRGEREFAIEFTSSIHDQIPRSRQLGARGS